MNDRLKQTLTDHIDEIEDGCFIDCYNNLILKNVSKTIKAAINSNNMSYVAKGAAGMKVTSQKFIDKETDIRIRKLTPKECWRLMGFTDEDYKKAASVVSETQLYKQAGNSIVVDVLMAIFKEML